MLCRGRGAPEATVLAAGLAKAPREIAAACNSLAVTWAELDGGYRRGFWCNSAARYSQRFWSAEGAAIAGFLGLDELFGGRHFDQEVRSVRQVISAVQTQLP
jgi:hypothetical protein